jgi:uncharacterized protein (TIGR02246 family)
VLAAGLLAGFGCGWRPRGGGEDGPRPGDLEAIGRLGGEYVAAYGEGDSERIASLFAGGAVLMPSDGPTCGGHDEIADYFDDLFRDAPATAEFEVRETKVLDGWAFERIDVTLSWSDPETGEDLVTWERYFWVLQRQPDGAWRIARLVVNTEEPANTGDETTGDGRRT